MKSSSDSAKVTSAFSDTPAEQLAAPVWGATTQEPSGGGCSHRTHDGRTINRASVDTTLLSRYGPQQARKSKQLLVAKGGDVFAKPGARCQVLENGSLRLLPA